MMALLTGRSRPIPILAVVIGAAAAGAAAPASLYDWMARAPIVVLGNVVVDDERFIEFEAAVVLRGGVAPGTRLAVDVRSANRDRAVGTPALKPIAGQSFLVLLEPGAKKGKTIYCLVRGIDGARELPEEGRQVFVDAVTKLAAVQALRNDVLEWQEFRRMLEETNPLLVETALELYEKFRRAGPEELPVLRPLLDHPRPELRAAAARVIGLVAEGHEKIPQEQSAEIVGELIARARRDEVITVRVAATGALAGFPSASVDELLHKIATDDPDQAVRLEAQKTLYERGAADSSPARPN